MRNIIVTEFFKFAHAGIEVEEFHPSDVVVPVSAECADVAIAHHGALDADLLAAQRAESAAEAQRVAHAAEQRAADERAAEQRAADERAAADLEAGRQQEADAAAAAAAAQQAGEQTASQSSTTPPPDNKAHESAPENRDAAGQRKVKTKAAD